MQQNLPDSPARLLAEAVRRRGGLSVYIRTYGCQQNLSDSERIAGILQEAGCAFVSREDEADLILFNTCAVRESAENRVFGHVGRLKKLKEKNPGLLIALGGCMVRQPQIAGRIKSSYPHVDILFDTGALHRLPALILRRMAGEGRLLELEPEDGLEEGVPVLHQAGYRALIPVMYGCDNFCSYCIVPYVRGRERSRKSADIAAEFRAVVAKGYKDIMLLGQNVNSYGKNSGEDVNFSSLLQTLNAVKGDFTIRFMTSHPKDATEELFQTIAACEKVSRHIHLPVQSGSNRVLKAMNRGYTREEYLALVGKARAIIKGVTFTSDIIVGFPGETERDFADTEDLVKQVRFYSLFTFIYSKRTGTAAADLLDETGHGEKAGRLIALTEIQDGISLEYDRGMIGSVRRGVIAAKGEDGLEVRLDNNAVVSASGSGEVGAFCGVRITEVINRRLCGRIE